MGLDLTWVQRHNMGALLGNTTWNFSSDHLERYRQFLKYQCIKEKGIESNFVFEVVLAMLCSP